MGGLAERLQMSVLLSASALPPESPPAISTVPLLSATAAACSRGIVMVGPAVKVQVVGSLKVQVVGSKMSVVAVTGLSPGPSIPPAIRTFPCANSVAVANARDVDIRLVRVRKVL